MCSSVRTSRKSRLGIPSCSLYSGCNLSLGKTPVIDIHELKQHAAFLDLQNFRIKTQSRHSMSFLYFFSPLHQNKI